MSFYLFRGLAIVSGLSELVRQVKIFWAVLQGKKILNIILIKPSKYDDETGFVLQDWRGVLPSNTLATIYSLIKDIQDNWRLGANVRIVIRVYDEAVQRVRPSQISRLCQLFPAKSLAMLVGVQTNQFVRATDLALAFQKRRIQTIIGGFHVSGVLAKFPQNGEAINKQAFQKLGIEKLKSHGISLFAGEAEGRMLNLLQDFMAGKLKSIYNYLHQPPDLKNEPIPMTIPGIGGHFAMPHTGTIDACRGCPFKCSFCTIRTVQGTTIRARGVQDFRDAIRMNWKKGIRSYFFTSDNAARDPLWKERFNTLIAMRKKEGIAIEFTMQVDTQCYKIPSFIEKATQAGCRHAFIGLESVNQENLKAVRKVQNRVSDYHDLNNAFRSRGIAVHYGYMIGLPYDTKESIACDIQTLMKLGPDLVSFFMVIPLPGSDDHYQMFCKGEWMDPDLNAYDSFARPVSKHPRMNHKEWLSVYWNAWQTFYSVENMIKILKRTKRQFYWGNFWNLIWYKHAIEVAQRHPMISGFVRLRDKKSRRNTFPSLKGLEFLLYKLRGAFRMWKRTIRLILDLTEVWLQTRERSTLEQKVAVLATNLHPGEWFAVKLKELRKIYQSLDGKVPSKLKLIRQRITLRPTRSDIQAHWFSVRRKLARGKFWALLQWKSIRAMVAESVIVSKFLHTLFHSWKGR